MLVCSTFGFTVSFFLVPEILISTEDAFSIFGEMVASSAFFALVGGKGRFPPGVVVWTVDTNRCFLVFVLILGIAFDATGVEFIKSLLTLLIMEGRQTID